MHHVFVLYVFDTFCANVVLRACVCVCVCVCLLMSFLIDFVVVRGAFSLFHGFVFMNQPLVPASWLCVLLLPCSSVFVSFS